ncbi:MAG: PilZ domain-containing protein, partial [Acidobacteriota bacterium]|nr:PilZ domain-containing protein [Acidobacteriota bacterium]
MHEVESSQTGTERRRSERVSQSLPIVVRGVDLLGQPFEERSSTLNLNLHGCRYASKYHLPKNTWITLEIPHGAERENVRARVAWIQRPRSIREPFQIAVEMESPGNFWALEEPPADWTPGAVPAYAATDRTRTAPTVASPEGKTHHMTQGTSATGAATEVAAAREQPATTDSPLLREWRADIEREASVTVEKAAARVVEQIRAILDEYQQGRADAVAVFSAELAAKQQSMLEIVRSELDCDARGLRELLHELQHSSEGLRAENQAALDSISRLAQARLHAEAAQLPPPAEVPASQGADLEHAASELRARMQSELSLAQSQWTELLQSSLDSTVDRLVKQLSGRSQEIVREGEQKLAERLSDLRQPLAQISSAAQETLA